MNREKIKSIIKKLVLREITHSNFGVGKISSETELTKDVNKSVGKAGEAIENPLNGKISVDDKVGGNKYQAEITENGTGLYDVNVVTNGGDRKVGRQLSAEKLAEFLKDSVKDKKSYTDKAWEKAKAPIKNKEEAKDEIDEDDADDEMTDTKEETQLKISDKETQKAEVKPDTEDMPEIGGEIVDKIEKIIDRVLKNKQKADTKTAFLKTDSKMESPDKLMAKLKDTPAMKK